MPVASFGDTRLSFYRCPRLLFLDVEPCIAGQLALISGELEAIGLSQNNNCRQYPTPGNEQRFLTAFFTDSSLSNRERISAWISFSCLSSNATCCCKRFTLPGFGSAWACSACKWF